MYCHRRLARPTGRSIEKRDADSLLNGRDGLRDCTLRFSKMDSGLGHAAMLHDGKKDMQIAQSYTPADSAVPVGYSCH